MTGKNGNKTPMQDRAQGGMMISRRAMVAGLICLGTTACLASPPLASVPPQPRTLQLATAEDRAITVSVWSPQGPAAGTIVFSHGAGSAPDKYLRLIEPWVAGGWTILAPLHVDSRDHPDRAQYAGMASWRARIEDMRAISDHLGDQNYIAAGHSYGGLVALTLGGAQAIPPEGLSAPLRDQNVTAVIALSPPAPIPVLVTTEGYAQLAVPALVQTGTKDNIAGTAGENWQGHLTPFEAAAAGGDRFALVLEDVDHYFGGAICDFDQPGPPQHMQLASAVDISTLFLRGYGKRETLARTNLQARRNSELPVRLLYK